MDEGVCKTCNYGKFDYMEKKTVGGEEVLLDNSVGCCLRRSPTETDEWGFAKFPMVRENFWCGEYKYG